MKEILLKDLKKGFSGPDGSREVLRGIDARLEPGEITVIVGPSGCGKTTLLRLLAGLEQPDGGEIEREPDCRPVMLFQDPRLMPWLTAAENVELALGGAPDRRERSRELLAQVGLPGFETHFPHQLSAGMQQRVALARALASRADLLLMDEPFAALDCFTREKMQKLLLELQEQYRRTIVFVTHQLDEAALLGSRILMMRAGRLTGQVDMSHLGIPRDILDPALLEVQRRLREGFREEMR